MTVEELDNIKKRVLEEVDRRYVHVDTCNDLQQQNNSRFANDDTRIKLFEQKLKTYEWTFKLIATSTVGTLITSILSLVLK
jgi:hypothetical protein